MGVTTANCFVCGQGTTVQFHFQREGKKSKEELLGQWRKKWSVSLCHVLQLSDSFQSIFNEASFCFNCQEAVCRAEFTVNAISRLQKEIGVIREELKGNFQSHYENLMQGREELDATGNEYKNIEDIIREITIKLEPDDPFLDVDNLAEREILIPGINLHENELPGLELVDPLENSSDSLETAIDQSDEDDSVLQTPLFSTVTEMRHVRARLVRRSGRNINSRVNRREASGSSSDSGRDFEESADRDQDFSGTEMTEDGNEVPESKLVKPRSTQWMVRLNCNFEECKAKNLSFRRASDMRAHVTEKHDAQSRDTLYHCQQCPLRFNSFEILARHSIKCNAEHQKLNCSRCGKELKSSRNMEFHLKFCRENKKLDKKPIRNVHPPKLQGAATEAPTNPAANKRGGKYKLTCNIESCRDNNLEFEFRPEMYEHILNWHDGLGVDKLYHCPQCPEQYSRRVTLRSHVKSAHSKRRSALDSPNHKWALNCSICLKGFNEESTLKEHEILHVPETPYACVLCSEQKNLNSAAHLRRHVQSAHDGKRYWCTMEPCLSSFVAFSFPREMKSHYMTEHPEEDNQRVYHCTECPSRFTTSKYLVHHSETHKPHRSYLCIICGKTFRTEKVLKQHGSYFHTELQMKPKCSHCTKSFEGAAEVEEHEKLHSDESPFKCVICEKMLGTTLELQRHVAASHELLEFECPVEGCNVKCASKPRLKWHQRTAHGSKMFACPLCPVRFHAPSAVRTHMFAHTGERPYSCHVSGCGKKYINKSHVIKHVRTCHQEKDRRFECRLCGKLFRERETLSLHEVTHGDARPFMCDICPTTCKTRRSLTAHMKVHRKTVGTNPKVQRQLKRRIPPISVPPQM